MGLIDPEGNLVISDYGSHSFQKFSPITFRFLGWLGRDATGHFHAWDKSGKPAESRLEGGFDRPHGMTWDDQGNLIVADTWNHRLQKFDQKGNILGMFGGKVDVPVSLDRCGDSIVVSENGPSRVQCFDLKGGLKWAKEGFNHPYDVKLKGKTLFVCDSDNRRVVIEDL